MTTMLDNPHYRRLRANGDTVTAAFWSVRRHAHFMKTLRADIAAHNKRSKAAKKAWKVRKAAAKARAC